MTIIIPQLICKPFTIIHSTISWPTVIKIITSSLLLHVFLPIPHPVLSRHPIEAAQIWHIVNSEDVEDDDWDDGRDYDDKASDEGLFLLPPSGVGLWAGLWSGASSGSLTWLRRRWEQKGADEPPNGQQGEEQRAQHGPDTPSCGADCIAAAFRLLRKKERQRQHGGSDGRWQTHNLIVEISKCFVAEKSSAV